MPTLSGPRLGASLCLFAACLFAALCAHAQKFQPKSIQFVGAPEYSTQELLDAAGLKTGVVLDYAEMNDHSKQLMDTGMFATLAFKFDGQDMIFTLTPATDLYPVVFTNLPFLAGKELDDALHRQLPLYRGKAPAVEGGLTEHLRSALQQYLKTKGVEATVTAVPQFDPDSRKPVAMDYAITAPPILVGDVVTEGAVIALDPKARSVLATLPGALYDSATSPRRIETLLGNYYTEQGYLQAHVHAVASVKPVIAADAVRVPFRVTLDPGVQYKLAAIQLPPGSPVSQADFDKQSTIHAGDIADGTRLRGNWEFLSRQYHNHGYIKAKIEPVPAFDPAHQTVTYTVTVNPGPQYTMGTLTIDNVTDQLRTAMLAAWKMPAGAVFNEGAIMGYFATHGVNPALEHVFSAVNCKYTMNTHDDSHTVDLTLKLEKKP